MIDAEYETALLARLLVSSSLMDQCDLTATEFSTENHQQIYAVMSELHRDGEVVDVITIADSLYTQTDRNWLPVLMDIASSGLPMSSVPEYVDYIRGKNQSRKAVEIATELIERSMAAGAIDNAIRDLMLLSQPTKKHEYTMDEALQLGVEAVDRAFRGEDAGIPTGYKDLDKKLGGMHGGDLIVIGARPAMGKTAMLINIATHQAINGRASALFSGEQPAVQAAQRMIASTGQVSLMKMRNGSLEQHEWAKLSNGVHRLKNKNLMIDDTPSPSLDHIIKSARRLKHSHNIQCIFIDYLQRMSTDPRKKRYESVGDNVRGLKNLARELDIPVVVLAQVGRDVEKRADKRPSMGDLSDSSEVEKEADQIFMLYRDEVYNENTDSAGVCEVLIEKNRHGPTGYIRLMWNGEYVEFKNMAYAEAS